LAYQPGTTVPDLAQLLAGWDGKGQPDGKPWQPMRTAYNILTVPKGKRQQIELPDHTKIILNTGSSLRYPVTIGGDRRMVELRGEAYFDVAADPSRPFVVKTADQEIKVLGTRFAVRNYPNEPQQSTILEDGKVSVAGSKGAVILQPGQEVLISAEDGMHVRSGINVTSALSWKAGYFNFDGLDIRAAVWRIAQWYGMQVYFEKGVKKGTLGSGDIQDGLPLGRLLEDLELPDLHFKIKNDTIIVKR
jgi:ferric-dicitrate binding protein FerR (iron transport regulator)